ncbi:hypothetical protein [Rhodanobacter thiooxydans]|uniref:hypothetical protein n=1 Tax=Rhodanobacter thiooxydans TaxID=416169 RepID=UPI000260DA2A|nr:hypothetical protein [Rhodanobacter thiooxydans]EIL99123.1 hypothetical protein UUA_08956 [Rhodanobacter thiooxydans LCS2]
MGAARKASRREIYRSVIAHAGHECEDCMRLAQFADDNEINPSGIAAGLRKFAAYHSENAFAAARQLQMTP